ncbi:zinc finger protein OZF-like [Labrus mixtus]|uniref:zinc finger protein OZF-like n=1 Tax=Labrus mixtus TaxID=508554 RepID=UPI0029C037C8|nr:zinc finger protein OZF-like [Labrus mixtus]
MAGFKDLKELFSRRLLAAVIRDITEERTTSGYEEELHRQRKLLDVILTPEIKLQRTDVQQLLVSKEELPPEQQEWSHILDQEDTKPQHIKEEHEELWISQEEEQLQGLEEADTAKFTFTPVSVKSEDDEEKPQSSQLHQRQTEQMETGVDGEDCGGAEPERDSDPERRLQPETEDSGEPETDDSDDWKETREDLSELNLKNKKLKTGKRPHSCSECGKRFNQKGNLTKHMLVHTGEKPFSCSVCSKSFTQRQHLTTHMLVHTGEKAFSCSVCSESFTLRQHLTRHMLVHTGEKPFSCSVCSKSFTQRGTLTTHMLVHTGEKPFSCSVCSKSFTVRGSLTTHMLVHTGEKPFSCSVCSKSFTVRGSLTIHMLVHTGDKPFSCSVCSKSFTRRQHLTTHMMIHTGERC